MLTETRDMTVAANADERGKTSAIDVTRPG